MSLFKRKKKYMSPEEEHIFDRLVMMKEVVYSKFILGVIDEEELKRAYLELDRLSRVLEKEYD